MKDIAGYRDCRKISIGLYSKVVGAIRKSDGVEVVLKLPKSAAPTEEEIATFAHEKRMLEIVSGAESCPRLLPDEEGENAPIIVMERILHHTVGALLAAEKKFALEPFLHFALAAVEALEELHKRGIIHRDIEPNNLLYDREKRRCWIVDYSLAVAIDHQKCLPRNPEFLEGTLPYISPEQTGRMNRGVDYRSDFYSLGALFYHLLAGKPPFTAEKPFQLVYSHIARLPMALSHLEATVPEVLSDIILKLLSKDPEERYQSIAGIRGDLKRCLESLEGGKIAPFAIGGSDTFERFLIPEKIYGREKELESLLNSYEGVMEGGSALIFVSGYSGVGKSSLVQELRIPLSEREGRLIGGKCDQFRRNIPYSPLIQAFEEYVAAMLRESDEKLAAFRNRAVEAVGRNGLIMTRLVPPLELVIGSQPPLPELGLEETNNRLIYTFTRFVATLATAERPLILFLDDLQWADMATIRMLELIVEDQNSHLLIIGGYRDNEVDEGHPLLLMAKRLAAVELVKRELTLHPLTEAAAEQLIADALNRKKEEISPLAAICFEKSAGNPFFLVQLLLKLVEEKLIRYDSESALWVWEEEAVRQAPLAASALELMVEKIARLPPPLQKVLKRSSAIGNRFDLEILAALLGVEIELLRPDIEELLKEKMIYTEESHYYNARTFRFAHDRIQQAAHEMLGEKERGELHLAVAREMEKRGRKEEDKPLIAIVDHYNRALDVDSCLVAEGEERRRIAALDVAAAKLAHSFGAYEEGIDYAEKALLWLQRERWSCDYCLLIDLYSTAIECAFFLGDDERIDRYEKKIADKSKDPLDETRAASARALHLASLSLYDEAIDLLYDLVERLTGIAYPKNPKKGRVVWEFLSLTALLARKRLTPKRLAKLPWMENERIERAFSLLTISGLLSLTAGRPYEMVTTNLLCFKLAVHHGNSLYSAMIYIGYMVILITIGKLSEAKEYGALAKRIAKERGDQKVLLLVDLAHYIYLNHWRGADKKSPEKLHAFYREFFEMGDLRNSSIALFTSSNRAFYLGKPLPQLLEEMEDNIKNMEKLRQSDFFSLYLSMQRIALLLARREGEEDEEESPPSDLAPGIYFSHRLLEGFLLRNLQKAERAALKADRREESIRGLYDFAIYHFYSALTSAALFSKASFKERLFHKRRIKKATSHYKKFAANAPDNFKNKLLLLRAESARLRGHEREAEELYEQAIDEGLRCGFHHEKALAEELFARFYVEAGREKIATFYFKEALSSYRKWGAEGKIAQLEKEFPYLAEPLGEERKRLKERLAGRESSGEATTALIGAGKFDALAMQNASEVIASTIVMEELIYLLMRLAMEHGGAERGLLLIARDDEIFIEAESDRRSDATRLLSSEPVTEKALSLEVLKHILRSKRALVLEDAARRGDFKECSYIRRAKVRSLLCLPLLNKDRVTALLYLENNLTKNAFTEERTYLITTLSAQLAMAIDNAKLFERTIAVSRAFERFVPKDFISLLGKKDIVDLSVGDYVERKMCVLFTDIRSFTALSEKMTPIENFAFVNQFLALMEPVIRSHGGFIDKFIGDAIMALFPEKADDAVACAIAMVKALERFNEERASRGQEAIEIGIGLNSGTLILGTVGNEMRMDGTVISDAVNVASRVEHLTEELKTTLLITKSCYDELVEPERFFLRKVGESAIRGKSETLSLYTPISECSLQGRSF